MKALAAWLCCISFIVLSTFARSQTTSDRVSLIPPVPSTPVVVLDGLTAKVSWTGSAAVYHVTQRVNGGLWHNDTSTSAKNYVFPVEISKTFEYRVKACADYGYGLPPPEYPMLSSTTSSGTEVCSDWSAISTAITVPVVPMPPGPLKGLRIDNQFTLSWLPKVGATYYQISQQQIGGSKTYIKQSATSGNFTLSEGNSYQFLVQSCNSSGCSFASSGYAVTYKILDGYSLYSDAEGNIYLAAPKLFVLLHGEISIPLWVTPKNGLLKLSKVGSIWQLTVLTDAQWRAIQLTEDHQNIESVRYSDFDSDGKFDLRISFFDSTQPIITLSDVGDKIRLIVLLVRYLHTDVLGSVIAESDGSGNIIKKTDYKPFGESKDN